MNRMTINIEFENNLITYGVWYSLFALVCQPTCDWNTWNTQTDSSLVTCHRSYFVITLPLNMGLVHKWPDFNLSICVVWYMHDMLTSDRNFNICTFGLKFCFHYFYSRKFLSGSLCIKALYQVIPWSCYLPSCTRGICTGEDPPPP